MNIFIIIVWLFFFLGYLGIYYHKKIGEWAQGMTLWTCGLIGLFVPLLTCPLCLFLWWYGVDARQIAGCVFTGIGVSIMVTWFLGMIVISRE